MTKVPFRRHQYWFLTDLLDSLKSQLGDKCDDIDCDKFMYIDCLKKRIKPVLKHEQACLPKLVSQCGFVVDILKQRKFARYRYEKCEVCKKRIDTLDARQHDITAFSKPIGEGKNVLYHMKNSVTHRKCRAKLKVPKGYKKIF